MNEINIPKANPDFDAEPWRGSFQQLLSNNIGKTVRAEYNIGNNPPLVQQGVIYAVSTRYLLLWDESRRTYVTGDLYCLRSLTFFDGGQR